MNAVEKLQAAIDFLESKRNEATEGLQFWRQYNPLRGEQYGIDDGTGETIGRFEYARDAALFEVLHRTIDAQLAILRRAIEVERIWHGQFGHANVAPVALATAILGGS